MQALGLVRGSQGLPTPSHRERAHETNSGAEMQQRQPGDAVNAVALTAAPCAVILIVFLTALLRCERKGHPGSHVGFRRGPEGANAVGQRLAGGLQCSRLGSNPAMVR